MIAAEVQADLVEKLIEAETLASDLYDRLNDGAMAEGTDRQKIGEARAMIWEARKRVGPGGLVPDAE